MHSKIVVLLGVLAWWVQARSSEFNRNINLDKTEKVRFVGANLCNSLLLITDV
jgi:hypothetical protein